LIYLLTIMIVLFSGCSKRGAEQKVNATQYGVTSANSGQQNSENLQKLIDKLSENGGTIYIPAGEYMFGENGTQTIGSHCIKMKSNVSIVGDGEKTVLKPVGASDYGLDMFYHNDYLDAGQPVYLENCSFENFKIDAAGTSCHTYTSAGKGFMFNLLRNCHWKNVSVYNTDATGFGVDCPIDSSMTDCIAVNCGKAANADSSGASGFGIGYGFADRESIRIEGCTAAGNRKFGFFFEHQGRFDENRYQQGNDCSFLVTRCYAENNLYNYGGICAEYAVYENCDSGDALKQIFYFENCKNCMVSGCTGWEDEGKPNK